MKFSGETGDSAPLLGGSGTLAPGSPATLNVTGAPVSSLTFLVIGDGQRPLPFHGGTLIPDPVNVVLLLTDPNGTLSVTSSWPGGLPTGQQTVFQTWHADAGGPDGWSASNGLAAGRGAVGAPRARSAGGDAVGVSAAERG